MKNGGILRKIVFLVISSILICSIQVFASNVQSNANRQENRLVSTIGQTDDVVATTYEAATTNAKLNSLKNSFGSIQENFDYLIQNCSSKLTVWVNSHDEYYNGKTITLTKDGVTVRKCQMYSHNGRYEAEFPKLADGAYQVDYFFKIGNGGILHLKTNVTISGQDVLRQLFGDLQQMTMADIQAACKAGVINQFASVGDTFSGGTNYTYTIIGIDQDKPSDTNGNLLPSNSYGNVLTVMPLGAPAGKGNNQPVATNAYATPYATSYGSPTERINVSDISNAGWASSHMRSVIMASCYNKLPEATKNVIGSVQKITGTYFDGNQTTGDKVFLLSGKEVFGGSGYGSGSYCFSTEASATFQYQYFSNIATSIDSRKNITNVNIWWLRSPSCDGNPRFCYVLDGESGVGNESMEYGVLPAFCIY